MTPQELEEEYKNFLDYDPIDEEYANELINNPNNY